ncbi:MAG: hypothetical protein M0Q26_06680 [Chitinophagaceae bacterium]|nr:hypothetical protein [Chitinophagaceae bacterium]MDP1811443.1 hypothetical protein [Sediminibacterium sp.]MDP3127201.1 hypothetical protein [Sediminibacterium sp.]
MKKQLLIMFLISLTILSYSQGKNEKKSAIGISIPLIWNNSEATYYQLGSSRYPSGKAISYGININHFRTIYKNIFGIIGIGYFKQVFAIPRPFEFDDPTNLPFYTKSYKYDNIQLLAGFGYSKNLKNNFSIKGSLTYNQFYSYKQKYTPEYLSNSSFQSSQVNHKSMSIGRMINFNIGMEKNITKKISIGLDGLLPISNHWNNDDIFVKYYYPENSQQIGRNKFSIGTNISCIYHF